VHSYSNVPRPFGAGISVTHLADDPVWLACRTDDPINQAGGTARPQFVRKNSILPNGPG